MRIATLDLTPELFTEFCKASGSRGGAARMFIVKENALPDDAEVVAVEVVPQRAMGALPCLRLHIKSETFKDIANGEPFPSLRPVVYETQYA